MFVRSAKEVEEDGADGGVVERKRGRKAATWENGEQGERECETMEPMRRRRQSIRRLILCGAAPKWTRASWDWKKMQIDHRR